MKRTLILVLSADIPPYDKMIETSQITWDSIGVEGTETVYYCGASQKENTDKIIYLPVAESFYTMGEKLIKAFEWALENKQFDFIARPHSCIYVDKRELVKYIETLPETNVFAGLKVNTTPVWNWGGIGFILSKDVVKKVVEHQGYRRQDLMEDMQLSYLINDLGIPYTQGRGCSIDKTENGWNVMAYGCPGFEFTDWNDLKKLDNQFFYRCKQDGARWFEEFMMKEMFKVLQ